jgi:outer membrane protein TolC
MRALSQIGLLLLVAELAASGCAGRQCAPGPPCSIGSAPFDCQMVERKPLAFDLSAVAADAAALFDPARMYCNLLERDAQCLAARNSASGNFLEYEAEALEAQGRGLFHKKASRQQSAEILRLRGAHQRNTDASAALQALIRLAEAEAGVGNLDRRLQELSDMLAAVKRLQAAGLETPASQADVEAQHLPLVRQRIEIDITIEQLNHQLAKLIGADPPPSARFWPDVDLRVDTIVPVVEEAQGVALFQRADLAAMRLAASSSGGTSSSAVSALLAPTQAGVGGGGGGHGLLHPFARSDSDAARESQLQTALADQERAVNHEVALAVATVKARLQQIGLSRERLEAQRRRLEAAQRKEQVSPSGGFEARKAMLELLAADQDLFHDCIEWKMAVVRLREAEGSLAIECGFTEALDYADGAECCPIEAGPH